MTIQHEHVQNPHLGKKLLLATYCRHHILFVKVPIVWVLPHGVYNGLSFATKEDKKKLSKIIEKLDEFAIGEVNETHKRYVFNSSEQETDESINAYVAALHKLVQTCNLCLCLHDSVIRDRITLG